jgi:hypothetical protein
LFRPFNVCSLRNPLKQFQHNQLNTISSALDCQSAASVNPTCNTQHLPRELTSVPVYNTAMCTTTLNTYRPDTQHTWRDEARAGQPIPDHRMHTAHSLSYTLVQSPLRVEHCKFGTPNFAWKPPMIRYSTRIIEKTKQNSAQLADKALLQLLESTFCLDISINEYWLIDVFAPQNQPSPSVHPEIDNTNLTITRRHRYTVYL